MAKKHTVGQLLKAGAINRQQAMVLETLRKSSNALSNRKLSIYTGLPINVITPRCFQLRKMGFVVNDGREYDVETNRTVNVWTA